MTGVSLDSMEYALATDVDSKSEEKQAVLLKALGPAARKVYRTFTWTNADDSRKIANYIPDAD